jgi:hypothetical protein
MSSRTAERNRAIRLAWEREQKLVQEGTGTRDWTKEQQADILNPDKGKAYDDEGRAFQGQHMKSAAEYPEYAGNPDNIQFLTRDEHLEAHKGSWQNPTNWYYDPIEKTFTDFGDGAPIPCKPIELSNPITISTDNKQNEEKISSSDAAEKEHAKPRQNTEALKSEQLSPDAEPKVNPEIRTTTSKPANSPHIHAKENWLIGGLRAVGKTLKPVGQFIIHHPIESLEIAGVAIGGVAEIASAISGKNNNSNDRYDSNDDNNSEEKKKPDISTQIADIVEKANRASPKENDVSAHKQRYHTKDGVVWKDKAPYHRGGKDD